MKFKIFTATVLTSLTLALASVAAPVPKLPESLTLQAQAPDGKSAPDLTVVCIEQGSEAVVKGTAIMGGSQRLQTDAQGWFTVKTSGKNLGLMMANDAGFCLAQARDLTNRAALVLQPWARITGVRTDHGRPLANHPLSLQHVTRSVDLWIVSSFDIENKTSTDSQGHFVFEHVPPFEVFVEDVQPWQGANVSHAPVSARIQEVDCEPGKTAEVEVATHGRTIVGKIELDPRLIKTVDLKSLDESFNRGLRAESFDPAKRPQVPPESDNAAQRDKWYLNFLNNTEIGRQRKAALPRLRSIMIRADGTFVSSMVEPGKYVLTGNLWQKGKTLGLMEFHFTVPPATNGNEAMPVDVGTATLTAVVHLAAGDLAPNFTIPALDGSVVKLSALRGKYVLLDFWATWCVPCVAEMPNLKDTFEAFGKDPRFAMISLSDDYNREAPAKFAKANGLGWTQIYMKDEPSGASVQKAYGVTAIPQIILIGPDGKIIAPDLRGDKIKSTIAAALKNDRGQ